MAVRGDEMYVLFYLDQFAFSFDLDRFLTIFAMRAWAGRELIVRSGGWFRASRVRTIRLSHS